MKKLIYALLFCLPGLAMLSLAGCGAPAPDGQMVPAGVQATIAQPTLAQPTSAHAAATQASAAPVTSAPETAAANATFTDPFAYCVAVGTINAPDARYTGDPAPDAVIKGYLKAAGIEYQAQYSDTYKQMTIWRCMDKQVYACNFGANLPCDSQANTDNNPTQAMTDFCKANPGSDFIPMAVTGHDTIYSWHCIKDAPEVLEQISQVDAAGYLASIWYPVQPAP